MLHGCNSRVPSRTAAKRLGTRLRNGTSTATRPAPSAGTASSCRTPARPPPARSTIARAPRRRASRASRCRPHRARRSGRLARCNRSAARQASMRTTGRVSGGRARAAHAGAAPRQRAVSARRRGGDAEAGGRIRDRHQVIGFHRESIMRVTEARRSGRAIRRASGIEVRPGAARRRATGPSTQTAAIAGPRLSCRSRAAVRPSPAGAPPYRSFGGSRHRIEIRVQIALLARPLRGHRNGTQRAALHRFTEGLAGRASSFAASACASLSSAASESAASPNADSTVATAAPPRRTHRATPVGEPAGRHRGKSAATARRRPPSRRRPTTTLAS